jgi:hypothetical protein
MRDSSEGQYMSVFHLVRAHQLLGMQEAFVATRSSINGGYGGIRLIPRHYSRLIGLLEAASP